jgi:ATP-dependent RNA helicase DeaD
VLRAADERLAAELAGARRGGAADAAVEAAAEGAGEAPVPAPDAREPGEALCPAPDARLQQLAARLLADMDATELVAALLARAKHTGPCAPQPVTPVAPPRSEPSPRGRPAAPPWSGAPSRGRSAEAPWSGGPPRGRSAEAPWSGAPQRGRPAPRRGDDEQPPRLPFVPFQVNWGERHGADPRRLLALVCRRGGVSSRQIGAIRIGSTASVVEVASPAAPDFARAVNQPDARDARIRIVRASSMRVD